MPSPRTFGPFTESITQTTVKTTNRDVTAIYGQGFTDYAVFVDTTNWPVQATIVWTVEFSPDGGTTWGWGASNGPNGVSGGPHSHLGGAASPWPGVGGQLPQSNDPAATNAGWPTTQPAQVLVRASLTCSQLPSPANAQLQITIS